MSRSRYYPGRRRDRFLDDWRLAYRNRREDLRSGWGRVRIYRDRRYIPGNRLNRDESIQDYFNRFDHERLMDSHKGTGFARVEPPWLAWEERQIDAPSSTPSTSNSKHRCGV